MSRRAGGLDWQSDEGRRRLHVRTIYNSYSVISAMFRDAKLADPIE